MEPTRGGAARPNLAREPQYSAQHGGVLEDGPETWNFAAPIRPLKPYMSAVVCETYREWALLLEKHAPQSPDPERLQLEALVIRGMAKIARGYAGLRPWNTWDWKPAVSNFPHGKPW